LFKNYSSFIQGSLVIMYKNERGITMYNEHEYPYDKTEKRSSEIVAEKAFSALPPPYISEYPGQAKTLIPAAAAMPTRRKKKKGNLKFAAAFISVCMVASAAFGFGGAYLANILSDSPAYTNEGVSQSKSSSSFEADMEYLDAYLSDYLASLSLPDAMTGDISRLNTAPGASNSGQLTIPEIAALASNSVVEIYTESVINSGRMGQFVSEGAGSGVIISADGYIVTNNHVIEGSRRITVHLKSGVEFDAELIGRDSKTDLAVLKINAKGLQPAVYGNSDNLVAGELAVAIGNPLGKLGGTVTEGVISALSRNIEIDGHMMTLLQTSAAVNPGNSGGGLFNSKGELIGVVNAKSSGSDIEGIGFAIPVNLARSIVEALIEYGYVPGRIDFGAVLIDVLNPMTAMMYRVQNTGVYVSQTDSDSNLRSGDRIVSIDGRSIESTADINEILDSRKVGDILSITLDRSGSRITVNHILGQAKS